MDLTWIVDNWQSIFSVITILLVGVIWLYVRYWGKRELLRRDLLELLQNALEYLKSWAGDEMDDVSEADVAEVAYWFYDKFVAGHALAGIVTREAFKGLLWALFTRWRDMFLSVQYAEAEGLLLKRQQ